MIKKIKTNEKCPECKKTIDFALEMKADRYRYGQWKCSKCGFTKKGVLPPRKTRRSEFPYNEPKRIQKINTQKMKIKIKKLKRKDCVGSQLARFDLVDYSAGKGIVDDLEYCYWTHDGRRITVRKSKECRTKCISQSWRTDPWYPNREW